MLSLTGQKTLVPVMCLHCMHRKYLPDAGVVGDSTWKVVSPFAMANIANAIAKVSRSWSSQLTGDIDRSQDYANLLTRFALQDFPEDGGDGMSQVFHGEKLLHELPSPPAACVDEIIYFVDELLQDSSGGYFIPECFFLAMPNVPWVALLTEWNLEKRFMVSDWPSNEQMYIHFYST